MDQSEPKQPVRVTIFNQTYSLRATEEPGEIEALAHIVDELMTTIASRAGNIDATRMAVLACLHLADQFRTLERELASLKQRVERKSQDFAILLDRVIDVEESQDSNAG